MTDILIQGGTLITVDPARRIIENGALAIDKDRIVAVGPAKEVIRAHKARKVIDARGKVVMPGLIDTYGNSGTSFFKNIGEGISDAAHRNMDDFLKTRCSSEQYWDIEGRLVALERLKFGTTCFIHRFGVAPWGEEALNWRTNMRAIADVGLRQVGAVGPPRPPFPAVVSLWENGKRRDARVTFRDCFRAADRTIHDCHGSDGGRTNVWVGVPRFHAPTKQDPVFRPEYEKLSFEQAKAIKSLMRKHGTGLHSNAYGEAIEWCREKLDILGPKVLLCHCTALSRKGIRYLADTNTKVSHCPNAARIYSFPGECPVVEMIDQGICVSLGTDLIGSIRTGDQFKDMRVAMLLQRLRFRDGSCLPPGKVLEMATIDGARALGLEDQIGSLEVGKKADVILIETQQPHLVPVWMAPQRVAYQVTGHDVDTVLVDGKILMEGRKVKTVNETRILREAQREGEHVVKRGGLEPLMEMPEGFWGRSRY